MVMKLEGAKRLVAEHEGVFRCGGSSVSWSLVYVCLGGH